MDDIQGGTTPEGIPLGAMAGTVDIAMRHFAGIDMSSGALSFDPTLPDALDGVRVNLQYRGSWFRVEVSKKDLSIRVFPDAPGPVPIVFKGKRRTIKPGETRRFEL